MQVSVQQLSGTLGLMPLELVKLKPYLNNTGYESILSGVTVKVTVTSLVSGPNYRSTNDNCMQLGKPHLSPPRLHTGERRDPGAYSHLW